MQTEEKDQGYNFLYLLDFCYLPDEKEKTKLKGSKKSEASCLEVRLFHQ